jgi:hypothetical protein
MKLTVAVCHAAALGPCMYTLTYYACCHLEAVVVQLLL